MCCPRKIQRVELDPQSIAARGRDGKFDTLGAFAKGEIVRALRGHPACVRDLCRSLHEERSLFLRKKEFLETDIPRVRGWVGGCARGGEGWEGGVGAVCVWGVGGWRVVGWCFFGDGGVVGVQLFVSKESYGYCS